jgi:hypothetical protein
MQILAQNSFEASEKMYGLDQQLYSGRIYYYIPGQRVTGDQYWYSPEFMLGSVSRNDSLRGNQLLNFDVTNGYILLQFEHISHMRQTIILPDSLTEYVEINGSRYEYFRDDYGFRRIALIVGDSQLGIALVAYKELNLNPTTGLAQFEFSKLHFAKYLLHNDSKTYFRRKSTFLKLLDPALRADVRKFIRSNRISFRKNKPEQFAALLAYYQEIKTK